MMTMFLQLLNMLLLLIMMMMSMTTSMSLEKKGKKIQQQKRKKNYNLLARPLFNSLPESCIQSMQLGVEQTNLVNGDD